MTREPTSEAIEAGAEAASGVDGVRWADESMDVRDHYRHISRAALVAAAKASPVIPAAEFAASNARWNERVERAVALIPAPMEFDRHTLRTAAAKLLWDKRSMMPEHSDEIVDDVLTVVFAHYAREVIPASKCPQCEGRGYEPEMSEPRCPRCHGTGVAEAPDDL